MFLSLRSAWAVALFLRACHAAKGVHVDLQQGHQSTAGGDDGGEGGEYVRFAGDGSHSMLMLSGKGLEDFQRGELAKITAMAQAGQDALTDKYTIARSALNITHTKFEAASRAISAEISRRTKMLEDQYQQLAVALAHNKVGKCCCDAERVCSWQPFSTDALDKTCGDGSTDYRDQVMLPSGTVGSVLVDSLLNRCALSPSWQALRQDTPSNAAELIPSDTAPTFAIVVEEPVKSSEPEDRGDISSSTAGVIPSDIAPTLDTIEQVKSSEQEESRTGSDEAPAVNSGDSMPTAAPEQATFKISAHIRPRGQAFAEQRHRATPKVKTDALMQKQTEEQKVQEAKATKQKEHKVHEASKLRTHRSYWNGLSASVHPKQH